MFHLLAENAKLGPVGFLESRRKVSLARNATSMQAALWLLLAELLRQVSGGDVGSVNSPQWTTLIALTASLDTIVSLRITTIGIAVVGYL